MHKISNDILILIVIFLYHVNIKGIGLDNIVISISHDNARFSLHSKVGTDGFHQLVVKINLDFVVTVDIDFHIAAGTGGSTGTGPRVTGCHISIFDIPSLVTA